MSLWIDYLTSQLDIVIPILLYLLLFFMLGIMAVLFRKKRVLRNVFLWMIAIQIIGAAVLIGVGLWSTQEETYPLLVENAELEIEDYKAYQLTLAQQELINLMGYPDGFTLLYVNNDFVDRQETWYYINDQSAYTFVNGILLSTTEEIYFEDVEKRESGYQPEVFVYGIDPGTALGQADMNSFLMMATEDELIEDGTIYYGEDIVMGFVDNKLCYVETLFFDD